MDHSEPSVNFNYCFNLSCLHYHPVCFIDSLAGIENTFQLIGKYLSFKNGTMKEHQDAMYTYLKSQVL